MSHQSPNHSLQGTLRPPVFYKYTSANTAAIVLEGSRLRWSSPLLFNDVAEFQRMPRFEPTVAEAHALLPRVISSVVFDAEALDEERLGPPMKTLLRLVRHLVANGLSREELPQMLRAERPDADHRMEVALRQHFEALDVNTARILCVTTDYRNDAMWGNYAESHAGCVLGFRHIEELSTPLLEARQVTYSEERPIVGSGLDFLLYGDSRGLQRKTLHAVCFTKKLGWSYEQEWRALTWRPNETDRRHGDYLFYPEELESVTLGARASEATESRVRELLAEKYPCACLYRMSVTNGDLIRNSVF